MARIDMLGCSRVELLGAAVQVGGYFVFCHAGLNPITKDKIVVTNVPRSGSRQPWWMLEKCLRRERGEC